MSKREGLHSEHSDKTIDVVRGSNIVNVSLGAQRTMTVRLKRDKKDAASPEELAGEDQGTLDPTSGPIPGTPRIALPQNSMFVMGLKTNAKCLHAVNSDNCTLKMNSPEEQVEGGERTSLKFRHIGMVLLKDEKRFWGKGTKCKTKEEAGLVIYNKEEVRKLLSGFREENHKNDFY